MRTLSALLVIWLLAALRHWRVLCGGTLLSLLARRARQPYVGVAGLAATAGVITVRAMGE